MKEQKQKKYEGNDGKALHNLMSNAIYKKPMENVRNRINVKVINNEKYYLKCRLKSYYMLHKILDNNLIVIRKMKITLILNKPAYTGMCILDLSKVLMYDFHYDYIKNRQAAVQDFYLQTLIA